MYFAISRIQPDICGRVKIWHMLTLVQSFNSNERHVEVKDISRYLEWKKSEITHPNFRFGEPKFHVFEMSRIPITEGQTTTVWMHSVFNGKNQK